ncbi:diacylglycerol kinase epsilon-like isoform X1 [Biomphalaria glabrata]|uniref:Diacylglycerol kinase n=2 Tax=Biomphalaria glabrata TaxID=6526 RepID=A0A9W2ZSR9_BIOGL|nr:diacylglycerol kinase epsilon-like isoform X1 [Biomphalaria glabrata]
MIGYSCKATEMDDVTLSFLMMVTLLVLVALLMNQYRKYRLRHYSVPIWDSSKGHRFYMVDMFPSLTYCNIEEKRLSNGAECEACGICVDDHNMKEANKTIPCKATSIKADVLQHHWVRGNLPPYTHCLVCSIECGMHLALTDLRCAWCKNTVHDVCATKADLCDLGRFRKLIIPPHCIEVKWVGVKGTRQRRLVVKKLRHPQIDDWSPLIVIANRKSGSNDGQLILRHFRQHLNPAQVIDIHDISPQNALEWCNLLPEVTFTLLVCGGDGTIGWVLTAIENLQLMNSPRVCILPLGTGNDLSRVLGWGEGYSGDVDVSAILEKIELSRAVNLDRWSVHIKDSKHIPFYQHYKAYTMNNYLSFGVDALVTLNFHRQRESWPAVFTHRLINKVCYFTYGTKDVLERECKDLHKKLKVELDGREIELPELEGVVVLNISSWGGGCQPWGNNLEPNMTEPRYDDGKLEVMGLFSSFHIAQLQVGLATPLRLGQAQNIKITLHGGNTPMQIDGEPWEQHPATITITRKGQAAMMALSSPT